MKLINASLKKLLEKSGRHGDGAGLYFRTLGHDKAYWVALADEVLRKQDG